MKEKAGIVRCCWWPEDNVLLSICKSVIQTQMDHQITKAVLNGSGFGDDGSHTWSSWRGGCPRGCALLWVENGRNRSRSRRRSSDRPPSSWRRGCEPRPATPRCPSSEPRRSFASAPLGYHSDYGQANTCHHIPLAHVIQANRLFYDTKNSDNMS